MQYVARMAKYFIVSAVTTSLAELSLPWSTFLICIKLAVNFDSDRHTLKEYVQYVKRDSQHVCRVAQKSQIFLHLLFIASLWCLWTVLKMHLMLSVWSWKAFHIYSIFKNVTIFRVRNWILGLLHMISLKPCLCTFKIHCTFCFTKLWKLDFFFW